MELITTLAIIVKMIVTVTPQDMWEEFVFYRKNGYKEVAFDHIRRVGTSYKWEVIIASIAYYKYKPRIGDIVRFVGSPVEFVWNEENEKENMI